MIEESVMNPSRISVYAQWQTCAQRAEQNGEYCTRQSKRYDGTIKDTLDENMKKRNGERDEEDDRCIG